MTVKTRTLRDVVLCRTGKWKGLLGTVDMTPEKFQSAIDAYNDAEVDRGVVKLGHVSSLNAALGDGAPAFGWVENPRIDGDKLRADLVDIPEKLAGIIGKAYRSGSIEGRHNVTTPSGKHYPFVLRSFALLGNSAPAVKGLDPLPKLDDLDAVADLYASEHPGADDECTAESEDLILLGDLDDSLIPTPHGERGDTGSNDPGKAREDSQEEPDMAYPKSTLDALGLPEDATEEQVNQAIADRAAAKPEPEVAEPAEQEPEQPAAEQEPEANLSAGPETVTVSKAVWDDITARLDRLDQDSKTRHRREVLATALSEGRIVPAEQEKWETALSEAPEVTETLLSQLPARVNTTETGSDVALSAANLDGDQLDAYLDRILGVKPQGK